jgi:hypothetical protein
MRLFDMGFFAVVVYAITHGGEHDLHESVAVIAPTLASCQQRANEAAEQRNRNLEIRRQKGEAGEREFPVRYVCMER